jgi:quercetin dioxygenase-like cupin family protein
MRAVKGHAMLSSLQARPYALQGSEGPRRQLCAATVVIKASREQTGGAFNLLEATLPSGYATPLHIHYTEDVAVYVLEGTLTVFWGSETREALAGSYFFQPRGIPHGFRVDGTAPARLLYLTLPAGFDCFVSEHERLAPSADSEAVAARYKIEFLGPLPG